MNSYVEITDQNGTRRVSTAEIDSIMEYINEHIMQDRPLELGKSCHEAGEMIRTADLSNEQLRWLADQLMSKAFYYGRLWKSSLTRKHHTMLGQMLSVRDAAKCADPPVDLWPELDD